MKLIVNYKIKKMKTVKALENILTPPRFDISVNYANVLNVIFACLFFSTGMPLLLLIGTLSLAGMYWCEKYILFRYSVKPPTYSSYIY